jgi:hypothetical protein
MCHKTLPVRQRPVKSPVLCLVLSSSSELDESSLEKSRSLRVSQLGTSSSGTSSSSSFVPEAVLFLVVALAVVVSLGVVVLIRGGVKLLPLGAVGDEVGDVTALEAVPRRSPPLLAKPVQSSELSRQ